MPASYKYVNNETGEIAKLCDIDDEIAAHLGEVAQPIGGKAVWLELVTDAGLNILLASGGDHIDEKSFNEILAKFQAKTDKPVASEKELTCMKLFLYEKYTFHAWRGPNPG
jgi:hypothetical protein